MARFLFGLFVSLALSASMAAQATTPIKVVILGDSSLRARFVADLQDAAKEAKIQIVVTSKDDTTKRYTLIVAQDTTITSAAAAVVVLDQAGDVAASVVRSGRMTAGGALNACAKEVAKQLAALP